MQEEVPERPLKDGIRPELPTVAAMPENKKRGVDDGSSYAILQDSPGTTLSESLLSAPSKDKDNEEDHSEVYLLWQLAWPLLIANIAEEVSVLGMFIIWSALDSCGGVADDPSVNCKDAFYSAGISAGEPACPAGCTYNDGTDQLAAANDMYSGTQFTIVFIFGIQQALYTMVPQAAGAGSNRQVGVLLQTVLFWCVIVFGLPTALSWIYMGDALDYFGMVNDNCAAAISTVANSTAANSSAASWDKQPSPVAAHRRLGDTINQGELNAISSYGLASVTWMIPYVLLYTFTTWLESIEVVELAEPIKAVGSVARLGLAIVFVWYAELGLNGYAYASCVGYGLSLVLLLLIVFYYKGEHKPYWFGWDLKAALHPGLNWRLFTLSIPMIAQYALQNWANFFFQVRAVLDPFTVFELRVVCPAVAAFTNGVACCFRCCADAHVESRLPACSSVRRHWRVHEHRRLSIARHLRRRVRPGRELPRRKQASERKARRLARFPAGSVLWRIHLFADLSLSRVASCQILTGWRGQHCLPGNRGGGADSSHILLAELAVLGRVGHLAGADAERAVDC